MADSKSKKSGGSKKEKELTVSVNRQKTRTAASSRTAQSKKAPAKKAPAKAARPAKDPYEHIDEIIGICFIAVGLVSGILTYFKTAALLEPVVTFLFGLVGVLQYALPAVLVLIGVLLIVLPKKQSGTGSTLLIFGAVWSINCIIQLAVTPIGKSDFGEYVKTAYALGKLGKGGGFLSSVPAYGLAKLISGAGAIVVFSALAIVLLLIATRISIRSVGKKVIAKVDAIEDARKARLIDEKVGTDEKQEKPSARKPETRETDPGPKLADGRDSLSDASNIRRIRHPRTGAPEKEPEKTKKNDAPLDLMPKSGTLPNRADKTPDGAAYRANKVLEDPMIPPAAGVSNDPIGEYDPFETIEIVPEDNITGDTAETVSKPAPSEEKKEKPAPAEAPEESIKEPVPVPEYRKPPISLLRQPDRSESIANDSPSEKAKLLIETLASFNINARVMNISVGPVITRFEVQPAQGVRVNRITSLSNDIALALAAPRVRIEAPIPGKAAIGIEIPNKATAMVRLREVLDTREFMTASSPLTFALGKDIAGKPVYADLEKMPHMLIAGATGSGKSVCINSIILSTVYKSSPEEVRMILIDPKVVELSIFAPVPHLYCPVVTDPKKAAGVLKWACNEMDQRYMKMSKINARDLARFNALQDDPAERMPRLMIIIDELADLMIVSAKDVEESIARLAQLGRACGIHLIVATQRPSVDVITGLIKTNIPSRIAFAVSSAIDSRVILDGGGAEKLLGHGDMLFHANGAAKPIRAQGAYVSDEEVENIMQFFVDNRIEVPQDDRVLNSIPDLSAPTGQGNGKQEDELLPDAVRIVMDSGSASISMIQRRLRVGYARAARLVDIMEQLKFVSGFDGSKPRKVLIDEAGYAEFFGAGAVPAGVGEEE